MTATPLDLSCADEALGRYRHTFEVFSQLLVEQNLTLNLTRIVSKEQIWTRHFMDSLAALAVLDAAARGASARRPFAVIDVGSGAGFPALALAIARPTWQVVSVEATEKKARFQRLVCQMLGLDNVQVRGGRAEVLAHETTLRERFDAAAARAVAPLNVLAELTMAFVKPGGVGVFWKGPQVRDELPDADGAFKQMGSAPPRLLSYTLPDANATTFYLVTTQKHSNTPETCPRANFAAIKKRPLPCRLHTKKPGCEAGS